MLMTVQKRSLQTATLWLKVFWQETFPSRTCCLGLTGRNGGAAIAAQHGLLPVMLHTAPFSHESLICGKSQCKRCMVTDGGKLFAATRKERHSADKTPSAMARQYR